MRAHPPESGRPPTEQARFWRDNAEQLRQLSRAPTVDKPASEKMLELASEYDRLADDLDPDRKGL
jgi:hypothetical protein